MRSVIGLLLIGASGCTATPPCEDEIPGFVMAQEFIKDTLKAPSTAEFPMITDGSSTPTALPDGRCAFIVSTHVDAENSFGANIRQEFIVTVAPDPDGKNWKLIELQPM